MVKIFGDIQVRLELHRPTRDLALLDLGIDGELRAYDLAKLCVSHVGFGRIFDQRLVRRPTRGVRSLKGPGGRTLPQLRNAARQRG